MKPTLGTLYYDGTCRFCTEGVMDLRKWLERRGVEIKPFDLNEVGQTPDEMRLLCSDGREFGGADAALVVIAASWWGKPLAWLGRLPGIHALLDAGYRAVAKRRHCIGGACALPPVPKRKPRVLTLGRGWLLMGMLTTAAVWVGFTLGWEDWLRMWLIAVAMWLGFKGLALSTTAEDGWPRGWFGWLGFALWPGMDVAAFANRGRPKIYREKTGWIAAVATLRVIVGLVLVFWLSSLLENEVAVGWCGMAGMVLILHFGLFDLLALFWRRMGFDVERLMDAPWRARSLGDFWGARWNRAFSHVAKRALFRPMARSFGLVLGTMAGFLMSGVIHELVISVPARAGYGLPTLYFLVQGLGVLAERKLGWRRDWRGRMLMLVVLLVPAFWLFHPPFMAEVMLPMLERLAR